MQKQAHEIYYFDEFQLDLTRGSLCRGTEDLKLRPKSFDVLKYFAQNSGRLISKDELIDAVWHETAVTDDSLVQCLKDIRNALGDSSQSIIRTVPRRGYIFEKDVIENGSDTRIYAEESGFHLVIEESVETNGRFATGNNGPVTRSTAPQQYSRPTILERAAEGRKTIVFMVLIVPVIALAIAVGWPGYLKTTERPVGAFQDVKFQGLTHLGNIGNSAISPDGKYVVYTALDAGRESLLLRQIATDSTQQIIAPTPVHYFGVSFSRDGNYVYYVRAEKTPAPTHALYRIPALGGVSEKVLADLDWCPTFSPDGSQMSFVRDSESIGKSVLMIANADGTNEQKLAVRSLNEPYTYPAWSPDGSMIAVSTGSLELGDSFRDVVTVSVEDGSEKPVTTSKWYWIDKLAWLADGTGLIMSANREKSHVHNQVWSLAYPSGEAKLITSDSYNYTNISLTADSGTLLAGHTELLSHIWIAPEGDAVRARRISSGLGAYKHVRWTSDGKLVVSALGNNNVDIYLSSTDGKKSQQLTVNAGTNWGQEVSPDNRYIVFDSDRTGDFHIWRMGIDGTDPTQLTSGSGEKFADVSPDGKWVIYTAFQDWTLWKIPIEGGESTQIAPNYARQAAISPDGKWIVYMASENNRQIIMPFEGNSPIRTLDLPADAPVLQPVRWSPDSQGIQFVVRRDGAENIWQMPIDGGSAKQVTNFTSDGIFSYDWSDDGRSIAIVRGAWTADMVLISSN